MPKLSSLLGYLSFGAMCLCVWSAITFPVIKFGTETLLRIVDERIDRSQLNDEEVKSLDATLQRIVNNNKQWQESDVALRTISTGGFLVVALCSLVGALKARRLERQFELLPVSVIETRD
jgi:hypothetical protein